jgi:hypothetical protein
VVDAVERAAVGCVTAVTVAAGLAYLFLLAGLAVSALF